MGLREGNFDKMGLREGNFDFFLQKHAKNF